MKIRTSYLIPLLLIILLAVAFFPARKYYLFLKEPTAKLTDAVPPETALMLKAASFNKLLEILKISPLFNLSESIHNQINIRDVAGKMEEIATKNSFFGEMADHAEVILCLVPDASHNPRLLLLVSTGKLSSTKLRKQVSDLLKPGDQLLEDKSLPLKSYSLISGDSRVWVFADKGLMAVALNKETLSMSARTLLSAQHLLDDPDFKKLSETSGKKVDGILLVNSLNMAGSLFQAGENNPLKFRGSPFEGWMSLDLHVNTDKILMDGFTSGNSDSTLFDSQEPVDVAFAAYLPSNTAFALMVSFSAPLKYSAFFYNHDTLHCTGYDSVNQCSSMEIFRKHEQLNAWMGNSICFAAYPSYFSGNSLSSMTLIELRNTDSARMMLKPFIRSYEPGIGQLTDNRLIRNLWGSLFASDSEQYCVFLDKVMAVSPDPDILKTYITDEQRIARSELFTKNRSVISDKSNLLILANNNIWKSIYRNGHAIVNPEAARQWTWPMSNSTMAGLQISAGGKMLYTHAFILSDKNGAGPDNPPSAEIPLSDNDTIRLAEHPAEDIKKPESTPVKSQASGQNAIKLMVPATTGRISRTAFLINGNEVDAYSTDGRKQWSYTLKADNPAAIFESGLKGSSEVCFLIAGSRSVVLVDNNGRELRKSKVQSPASVQGETALFDYDRTKDYRMIFRGSDGKIYLINTDGSILPDWTLPQAENALAGPPVFIRTAGKDFILYGDSRGKLSITDRKGRTRIAIAEGFTKSVRSGIFENRSNSKGLFLMASAGGELAYINADGVVSLSKFGNHGNDPWFNYLDFDGDGSEDFIFAGKGKLTVYNKMKNALLNIDLQGGSFSDPVIYATPKTGWIAVRNRNTGEIILVSKNNQRYKGSTKLSSDSDPVFIFDEKKKKPVLVTRKLGKPEFTVL